MHRTGRALVLVLAWLGFALLTVAPVVVGGVWINEQNAGWYLLGMGICVHVMAVAVVVRCIGFRALGDRKRDECIVNARPCFDVQTFGDGSTAFNSLLLWSMMPAFWAGGLLLVALFHFCFWPVAVIAAAPVTAAVVGGIIRCTRDAHAEWDGLRDSATVVV